MIVDPKEVLGATVARMTFTGSTYLWQMHCRVTLRSIHSLNSSRSSGDKPGVRVACVSINRVHPTNHTMDP